MAENVGGGGGGRGESPGDKAREEFFSEAQEIVDGLSRDLLALDDVCRRGGSDAELVNDVFRAVHTLKGLSGLFGAAMMSGLSHELENLLDDLRLGRIELTSQVLDLLFQSVELYGRILAAAKGDAPEPAPEVKALLAALGQVAQQKGGGGGSVVAQYELDPGLLSVLTEYEEHRLRTNLQAGLSLYRMRVQFQLATIDSALDDLKAKTRPHGEIITFLPTGEGGDAESVELEILVASRANLGVLSGAVAGPNITVEEVRRRDGAPNPLASIPPPPMDHGQTHDFADPYGGMSMSPPTTSSGGDALLDEINAAGGGVTRTSAPPPAPSFPPIAGGNQPGTFPPGAVPGMPFPPIPGAGLGAGPGAAVAAGPSQRELTLRSVTQTVRVDIRKLDHLMNIVGELAIVRGVVARLSERVRLDPDLKEIAPDLHRLHRSFDRHLAQMQNGILEVRMVPLGQVFDKLARIVRQISREHDKQVNLVITGAETEIDKLIVEELSDPLMHVVRNAIDHGIEAAEERARVGKPAAGTIALNAFQKGNHVVIEVEDDGCGIDEAAIVARAVALGKIHPGEVEQLGRAEVLNLIFLPGLSTRDEAGAYSGRGVGMDVVKTNIAKLGGVIDLHSEAAIGTKLTITLPVTLAIVSALLLRIVGRVFAMPLTSVAEAMALDESQVRVIDGREVITLRGATLPICRLGKVFDLAPLPGASAPRRQYIVVAALGARRLGFAVDELQGQQDIVIKPLGKSLGRVRGFSGATELGDQRVALVLDPAALIEEMLRGVDVSRERRLGHG